MQKCRITDELPNLASTVTTLTIWEYMAIILLSEIAIERKRDLLAEQLSRTAMSMEKVMAPLYLNQKSIVSKVGDSTASQNGNLFISFFVQYLQSRKYINIYTNEHYRAKIVGRKRYMSVYYGVSKYSNVHI